MSIAGRPGSYTRRLGLVAMHLDELRTLEKHLLDRGGPVVVRLGDHTLEGGVNDLPNVRLKLLKGRLRLQVPDRDFEVVLAPREGLIASASGALGGPGRQLVDEVAGLLDARRYDARAVLQLLVTPILGWVTGAALVIAAFTYDAASGLMQAVYLAGGVVFIAGAGISMTRLREDGGAVVLPHTAGEAGRERRRTRRDLLFLAGGGVLGVLGQLLYDLASSGAV